MFQTWSLQQRGLQQTRLNGCYGITNAFLQTPVLKSMVWAYVVICMCICMYVQICICTLYFHMLKHNGGTTILLQLYSNDTNTAL